MRGRSWRTSTFWDPALMNRVDTMSTWSTSPFTNGITAAVATSRASAKVGRSDIPRNDRSTAWPRKRKYPTAFLPTVTSRASTLSPARLVNRRSVVRKTVVL